jgi:hypothetical protein
MIVTREYLRANPNHVFVFGDNLLRRGRGGAAILRDEPNTRGFTTKKAPNNEDASFYRPDEYRPIFQKEMYDLAWVIFDHPERTYLISSLGSGLANRYQIWEWVIKPGLESIRAFPNVVFLWEK